MFKNYTARLSLIGERSRGLSLLLSLLFPGLGHVYWGDWLFGGFVFLISLIAAVLAFAMMHVELFFWARALLVGLPTVFYLLSFLDLFRVAKSRRGRRIQRYGNIIFIAVGLIYQFACPLTPVNYLMWNRESQFKRSGGSPAAGWSEHPNSRQHRISTVSIK